MFERIGRAAETVAARVSLSRRGFLGRLGERALVAAGAVGGLLLTAGDTRAGPGNCCQTGRCPPGKVCTGGCKCMRIF
jgi:hypothetical protein